MTAFKRILVRALAVLLLASLQVDAEGPPPPTTKPSAYGNTPESVAPFHDFREPYQRFFQEVLPFRGAGRDKAHDGKRDTIPIGFMGPIGNAPDADLGQQMLDGASLAFEQANEHGGYKGIPFKLIVRPDTGLWGATSNEMTAFRYEDDALAVIGSIDGANTHIALRVALKTETVIINTADTDPTLTETNLPWIVRCIADDRQQGYALAYHIFQECGMDTVAAFRVNDRYGRVGIAEFRDAARRLRHPLRVEMRWERGSRDFSTQLDRIADTGAQAIVLWGNASDCAAVVRTIRDRNMPLRVFGCDRMASKTFLAKAGEAAEGVVAAATFDPTRADSRYRSFVSAFKKRFGHEPDAYAAHGYDGAGIVIEAVRRAGLNRVRIRDALFEMNGYDGVTGRVVFDASRNDVGSVYLAEVRDGRFSYKKADFAKITRVGSTRPVYRTLMQSAPAARSPAQSPKNTKALNRVGCFLPLDTTGTAVVNGIRMALEDDAARHPDRPAIELKVRDARGAWSDNSAGLTELIFDEEVLAVIGSTERRGTHLAETMAAKLHVPIVALCGTDPTITQIPLPWVFNVAPGGGRIDPAFLKRYRARHGNVACASAALGYDAGMLVATRMRDGARSRLAVRDGLAHTGFQVGVTGTFRFDSLGNRVDFAARENG